MAVTNRKSDVLTLQDAASGARLGRDKFASEVLFVPFETTQTDADGDANSTLELVKVPSGTRVIMPLTYVTYSAFGASRVLSFGHRAYTDKDGSTVAEDLTDFGTALDVSAAGTSALTALTSALNSRLFEGDVVLVAQCTGGTIPQNATLNGVIACTRQ